MAQVNFDNVRIAGIAGSVPNRIINNRDYKELVGEDVVDKFILSTGILQRRRADVRQTAGDLAYVACNNMLNEFNIDRNEIGAVIFISTNPDYVSPATAFVLHKRLGLSDECIAFDVNLACPAYVYGIQICASLLQSLKQKYILLANGHAPKNLYIDDRKELDHSALMMFGDAATATLFERTENENRIMTSLGADATNFQMSYTLGGARNAAAQCESFVACDGLEHFMTDWIMDGISMFSFSTRKIPESINVFLSGNGETLDDYDKIVLHQPNRLIINRIIKLLKGNPDKFPTTIEKYGNTSGCAIPLTIVDFMGNMHGDASLRLLLSGFGTGLAWGVVSLNIEEKVVLPIYYSDEIYEEGELYKFAAGEKDR